MIAEAVAICCRFFVVEECMMIKEMSIDLETYSDVDIKKSGAYRYVESPAFEILLFAVSINGSPVTVYDMASGDVLPENILQALVDDSVTKWAFNAAFERICLSEYLRREFPELMKSEYFALRELSIFI